MIGIQLSLFMCSQVFHVFHVTELPSVSPGSCAVVTVHFVVTWHTSEEWRKSREILHHLI